MHTSRTIAVILGASSCLGLLDACGGGATPAPVTAPLAPLPSSASCARVTDPSRAPRPLTLTRAGSTVALADIGGKTFAYVADEDERAVHVIDVDGQKDVATTPLGGKPAQLMFLPDGRLVVTLRDRAVFEVLEPQADPTRGLDGRCAVGTDAEPFGLALTPDDAQLLVTSGWGRSLASYKAQVPSMQQSWDVALPREPRSVIASDDGSKAFVAQAVGGQVSVVDLPLQRVVPTETHATKENLAAASKAGAFGAGLSSFRFTTFSSMGTSCQGFALAKTEDPRGRVLVPQALVDPGNPLENTPGYGNPENDQTEVADVAVLDESGGDLLMASLEVSQARLARSMASDAAHAHEECLLPRSAAYDAKNKSLLVGCFGVDDVIAYDAFAASPVRAMKRRWDVAAGPSGIAVDPRGQRAVVFAQFERVVDVLSLAGPELVDDVGANKGGPAARIHLTETRMSIPTSIAVGRVLFHMVGDDRISHDGRACASCHPDGRDDSLTWATPNGPRRTIMLSGRINDTAPFSWSGSEHTLQEHMGITFTRLKGNGGLRSMELDALAQYVQTLAEPPAVANAAAKDRIARGSAIFHSPAAGCSSCHAGPLATDNLHHDVQSKTTADKSGSFNTPSLRFVGGGGPYFHDGRYKTLQQLLTDADRKMGHTAQLSGDDLQSMEAYLRSL
ncbi:MAG TPA: cytochrome C peroxidase [Polyangiaceae bacterium]|nr:cytochrome C peroxidase [Polyangiaceae bacterium]